MSTKTVSFKTVLIAAFAGAIAVAGLAGAASAETRWGFDHPRQHEVLSRAYGQERAVRRDYRDGEISRDRAFRLIRDDRRVAREDRFFARTNGGYISRGEQRFMNRQETNVGARLR